MGTIFPSGDTAFSVRKGFLKQKVREMMFSFCKCSVYIRDGKVTLKKSEAEINLQLKRNLITPNLHSLEVFRPNYLLLTSSHSDVQL
jgi:hypothetical protein